MANPIPGQTRDTFIVHLIPAAGTSVDPPPRVQPGILIQSDSKERSYPYNTDSTNVNWYVYFCYIVGDLGLSAFRQTIAKASGPGPAALAGVFDPTTPAEQVEWPPQSGSFHPATSQPLWVHFADLSGRVPNEPTNLASLADDAKKSTYNGSIEVVSR